MVHVIKLSLARDVIKLKVVQDMGNGAQGFNKIVSFIIAKVQRNIIKSIRNKNIFLFYHKDPMVMVCFSTLLNNQETFGYIYDSLK